jgi:hypothetical protein
MDYLEIFSVCVGNSWRSFAISVIMIDDFFCLKLCLEFVLCVRSCRWLFVGGSFDVLYFMFEGKMRLG